MADFSGANYVPRNLLDIKNGTTQPPASQLYPNNIMQKVSSGNLGGGNVSVGTQTRTLYRGTVAGVYVYNFNSPPPGAINVVVIGQV